MHHKHHVGLAARHAQMPNGAIVRLQRICNGSRFHNRQQIGNSLARALQMRRDPSSRIVRGTQALPQRVPKVQGIFQRSRRTRRRAFAFAQYLCAHRCFHHHLFRNVRHAFRSTFHFTSAWRPAPYHFCLTHIEAGGRFCVITEHSPCAID